MIDDIRGPGNRSTPKQNDPPKKKPGSLPPVDDDTPFIGVDEILDDPYKSTATAKAAKGSGNKFSLASLVAWWPRQWSKPKQIALGAAIGVVVLAIVGNILWWWQIQHRKAPPAPVVKKAEKKSPLPPAPTTLASPLTGVQVQPDLAKRPVTGIMIENSPDARPQSGLKDAGIVYEAVAEGGITRFLALFQEAQPDYIGPVRSARPYYLEWLAPYEASYAHVGGSPDALAAVKSLGIRDLDQFANAGAYQRITARFAPHNVYTSMAKMDELNNKKGYTSSNFTGFGRKEEKPAAPPTHRSINLSISSLLYNVHYDYDQASNSYKRVMGGKPHVDERSGAQLAPKVVVAMVMQKGLASDRVHTTYQTAGSGKLYVFQDGTAQEGTWNKSSTKAPFELKDTAGTTLKLNPGQTWVTVVAANGDVTAGP